MRCGSIAVKGEDAAPPRFKPRQRHGKRSTKNNPYSAIGLDKFARVYAELSAKRETIAAQTGAPPSLVRFVYAHRGWVPLVVRAGDDPKKIFGSDQKKKKKKKNPSEAADTNSGSLSLAEGKNSAPREVSPATRAGADGFPWSQVLRTTAFGFMAVSAVYVWKSAVPAGAVALVMVVAELQRRWQGGALAMKKLLEGGVSYVSQICVRRKANGTALQPIRTGDAAAKKISSNPKAKSAPGLALSAPVSPTVRAVSPPKGKGVIPASKPKKLRKAISMDDRPDRRKSGTAAAVQGRCLYDASVGATVVMIALGCLVLSGRLCATVCISIWWYLLPRLRPPHSRHRRSRLNRNAGGLSINGRDVDLRSGEYKKRVIMGGLVERSHLRP